MEEEKHLKKLYCDKAINYLKICIGILIFSGITYLLAIWFEGAFDFGSIFELIAFVFIFLAINLIEKHNIYSAKRNIVIAMLAIGWIFVYDLIILFINIEEVISEIATYYLSGDEFFYYLSPYIVDVTLIALLILLYRAYSSLAVADGSHQVNNYVDTFYDKL